MAARKLQCDEKLFEPGWYLGEGCFRRAYVCKHDDTKVVKIANDEDDVKYNRREYRMWQRASLARRKWMAAVIGMSADGTKLVMERAKRVPTHRFSELLDELDVYSLGFLDVHDANWGELPDGRFVCFDYAGP